MKRRDFQNRDCKPMNYGMISPNLKYSRLFAGKNDLLLYMEQALLRAMLVLPPEEQRESMRFIQTFEGKPRMALCLWFSEIRKQRNLSGQLLRFCRMKHN